MAGVALCDRCGIGGGRHQVALPLHADREGRGKIRPAVAAATTAASAISYRIPPVPYSIRPCKRSFSTHPSFKTRLNKGDATSKLTIK